MGGLGGRWDSGSDSGADTSAGRRLDRREMQTSMGGGGVFFSFWWLIAPFKIHFLRATNVK